MDRERQVRRRRHDKGPDAPAQMRLMIQRMLAERFKMKAHWEKREMPVYVLSK